MAYTSRVPRTPAIDDMPLSDLQKLSGRVDVLEQDSKSSNELLIRIDERLLNLINDVKLLRESFVTKSEFGSLEKAVDGKVSKDEFAPISKFVYGSVALGATSLGTAIFSFFTK